jgi:hypothetical protein
MQLKLLTTVLLFRQPVALYHRAHGTVKDKYPLPECLFNVAIHLNCILVHKNTSKGLNYKTSGKREGHFPLPCAMLPHILTSAAKLLPTK